MLGVLDLPFGFLIYSFFGGGGGELFLALLGAHVVVLDLPTLLFLIYRGTGHMLTLLTPALEPLHPPFESSLLMLFLPSSTLLIIPSNPLLVSFVCLFVVSSCFCSYLLLLVFLFIPGDPRLGGGVLFAASCYFYSLPLQLFLFIPANPPPPLRFLRSLSLDCSLHLLSLPF